MKNKDDIIFDASNIIAALVIDDVLGSIARRLKEVISEESIDNEIILKVYGQVIQWITMDYVDRAIDNRFFDKKIEFIKEICNLGIEVLKIREKERTKKFDS